MNLIFCIDTKGGMLFHSRRVSSDQMVCERILKLCEGKLWLAPYSRSLFPLDRELYISERFLEEAGETDWCFAETVDPSFYLDRTEKLVLFCWNRIYPSDLKFSIAILRSGWGLTYKEDFPGNSHERITMEVYQRCRKDG